MKATSKHLLAVTTTVDEVTNDVKPLFAFPVDVVKATEDSKSPFEVAAPSGVKRVQQYVDPVTGEVVDDGDCPRGVFIGDEFKPIDPDALAQIKAATKIETMVNLGTTPLEGIREKYGDRIVGRYFLQSPAKGGSAKAYKMTYDGLRGSKKQPPLAIISKRTARSKQKLVFIYADETEGCLAMCELTFAAQVREPDAQVKQPVETAEVTQQQIEMVRKVLEGSGDGLNALDTEADEAVALEAELVEQAIAGEAVTAPTPIAKTAESDDLMAQLEASLAS